MKYVPIVPVGLKDAKLIQFLTAVVKALRSVPDYQCYTVTVVWNAPFDLAIPTGQPTPRTTPPDVVRLGRAICSLDPETPVQFGATSWSWRGHDTVRIFDQAGLVEGVKYQLTFEVVG